MNTTTADERDRQGNWKPPVPLTLAPINAWPPQPKAVGRWFLGFPGFLWPYNTVLLGITLMTWFWLTPPLEAMASFEAWWLGWLWLRNLALVGLLFGGMHLYFYVYKVQGDDLRFSTREFARDSRRFWFRDQVRDNMFHTMVSGVAVTTLYEALTYWAFANGWLGWFDLGGGVAFWAWFALLIVAAPFIHSIHFYLGHRLLHVPWMYRHFHALHHRNVEVGPWSGMSMHPVEHVLYLSTFLVQWALALHPLNVLFQLQLAAFLPALSHSGFDKLKVGSSLKVEAGAYFHYLHHKYFECNYGGSLLPMDKWFGTFHDGTDEAHTTMRERLRERRLAERA